MGSSNGSPATAYGDSKLSASQPAFDALRSQDYPASSQFQNEFTKAPRSINDSENADATSTGAYHFDHGSVNIGHRLSNNGNGNHQTNKQLSPPFIDSRHGVSARQGHTSPNELFRSLRGEQQDAHDTGEEPRQMALEPFLPDEMVTAIQNSLQNCAEYERQCAQLEVSRWSRSPLLAC